MRGTLALLISLGALLFVPASPAAAAAPLPDLRIDTYYFSCCGMPIDTLTFSSTDCAVEEGYVTPGTHRLLRFSTVVINLGTADLKLGRPKANDPNWYFSPCHQHWHFVPFATYRLLDAAGNEVGTGHKQAFCIEDGNPYYTTDHGRPRYDCEHQGLQVGWEDGYFDYLAGQWIVIDGVPDGTYTLSTQINYVGVLSESNYSNNTASVTVTIPTT